jgi:sugar phosphate isomerase/epimerase
MRRAAIYARVSTVDGRQDPETQLRQLREYAERRGFPVAHEYVDHASGAKNDRTEYRAMLEAARRRQFDVLLVWRYDRFARSLRELVNALAEFEGIGINFISFNEGDDSREPFVLPGPRQQSREFERWVEVAAEVAGRPAIVPSVAGWARMTGLNTIFVDERDPYWRRFQVT